MKSLRHSLLAVIFAVTALVGCSKDEDAEPTTSLEMTVTDDLGNPVSGATVKLYTSQTDWEEQKNQFGSSQTSNAKGKVTFKDLEAINYFWFAEKDCMNNYNGGATLTSPLLANKVQNANAVLSSTGTMKFTNNSSHLYQIIVNGGLLITAEGKKSYTYKYVPTGTYTVKVIQETGYVAIPTEINYNVNVECGTTQSIVFP